MFRCVSRRLALLGLVAALAGPAVGCNKLNPHPFPQWNEGPDMSRGLDVYSGEVVRETVETTA